MDKSQKASPVTRLKSIRFIHMYKSLYIYIYIYINGCIIEVYTKIFIMKLEVFINEHHEKLLSLGHEF